MSPKLQARKNGEGQKVSANISYRIPIDILRFLHITVATFIFCIRMTGNRSWYRLLACNDQVMV